jgi:Ser/Thr protein kinase RdoA (MazF antagonist)
MLLDGYQEQFEFNMKELTLIEALRSLRIINYVTWIAFRWYDPAFKQAFPWFSTDQYWKDLLQSLTQQIINMKASELSIYSGYNQ